MSAPHASFSVGVDGTNPGQVVACCGLLELAHRKWPGVEGWFAESQFNVAIPSRAHASALSCLIKALASSVISGLSEGERNEREKLEKENRDLKKRGAKLTAELEKRRKELGEQARGGMLRIAKPFDLTLDWWNADDEATPKTWAGLQELHKVARSAQDALSGIVEETRLLDYGCVLRMPKEYRGSKSDDNKTVEPFYFDARRFAHRLDVGFSLDALEMEATAYPAVEILCLIGLQRFRPAATPGQRWSFDFWTWSRPLNAVVASPVFSGVAQIPGRQVHRFRLLFRDDQKRYKAFGPAIRIGGEL